MPGDRNQVELTAGKEQFWACQQKSGRFRMPRGWLDVANPFLFLMEIGKWGVNTSYTMPEFRQFHLRGREAAEGEWNLVCMAWNLKRMYALSS